MMKLLEGVHLNQSSFLLQFILSKLPTMRSYGIARYAETIACKRLEHLQNLPANVCHFNTCNASIYIKEHNFKN